MQTMFSAGPPSPSSRDFSPGKVDLLQLDPSAFHADDDLLQALEKHANSLDCSQDCVLFMQGDPPSRVFLLLEGEATVTMDSGAGGAVFSCQATSGSLLGLPALIGKQPYSLSATAKAGSRVKYIEQAEFDTLTQSELPLMVKVLQVLAAEVRSARLAIRQF